MYRINILIASVAILSLSGAVASAETFTFLPVFGAWDDDNNWEDSSGFPGTPGSTDTAVIPFGKTVFIDDYEAHVGRFEIDEAVLINPGGELHVHGDSEFTNSGAGITMLLGGGPGPDPKLVIHGEVEFSGFRASIKGGDVKGVIADTDGAKLTLAGGEIGPFLSDWLDVEVDLVNNTRVIAKRGFPLTLLGANVSGSGQWIVENGTLVLNTQIAGFSEFHVENGTLQVDTPNQELTGTFDMVGGTIDANEDFCFDGVFWLAGGTFDVADGVTLAFGRPCGTSP